MYHLINIWSKYVGLWNLKGSKLEGSKLHKTKLKGQNHIIGKLGRAKYVIMPKFSEIKNTQIC